MSVKRYNPRPIGLPASVYMHECDDGGWVAVHDYEAMREEVDLLKELHEWSDTCACMDCEWCKAADAYDAWKRKQGER